MIVYIIHLTRPVAHARHYIGTTKIFKKRMALHKAGRGAKILKRANELGITWRVVYKTWGGRNLERKLKRRKDAASICPLCKKRRNKAKARSRKKCRANARTLRAQWQS